MIWCQNTCLNWCPLEVTPKTQLIKSDTIAGVIKFICLYIYVTQTIKLKPMKMGQEYSALKIHNLLTNLM